MKRPVSWLVIVLIRLYQRTLSLDHGPMRYLRPHGQCKFHPTCSEYARQAFFTHDFWRAIGLSSRRVFRCHPWSLGGVDEVPKRQE